MSDKSTNHIRAVNVHKVYPLGDTEMIALAGVSFDINSGAFISLSGTSGSGKTTLLNLLGGLDLATSGEIFIEDRKLNDLSDTELSHFRSRHLGFIFQTFNLLPVLSAVENVEYPLFKQGHPSALRKQMAMDALKKVGLEKFAANRPQQLSGGQRQRVAIARAFVHQPRLIIADEPTANLDKKTAGGILDLLKDLNQTLGVTIAIATHDPDVISRTDYSLHLSDGKLVTK